MAKGEHIPAMSGQAARGHLCGKEAFDLHSPQVDLRQLHHFLAIVQYGSISSAAAALGIAQPSLSEYLSRLERKLGIKLFDRGVRGIDLTEAGLLLAQSGRDILRKMDLTVKNVLLLAEAPGGVVSVGFPPSLSALLMVPLIETVQTELPGLRLRLSEAMSGDIHDWVKSGRLDFGYVFDMPDTDDLALRPVMNEELFLVTAPDNWDFVKDRHDEGAVVVRWQEIQRLPLVLPCGRHGLRELIERHARANGVRLNVIAEIDSLSEIVAMVDRASAYTILPDTAVFRQVRARTLALVGIEKPLQRPVNVIRSRTKPLSNSVIAVERTISTIMREMIGRYNLRSTIE